MRRGNAHEGQDGQHERYRREHFGSGRRTDAAMVSQMELAMAAGHPQREVEAGDGGRRRWMSEGVELQRMKDEVQSQVQVVWKLKKEVKTGSILERYSDMLYFPFQPRKSSLHEKPATSVHITTNDERRRRREAKKERKKRRVMRQTGAQSYAVTASAILALHLSSKTNPH